MVFSKDELVFKVLSHHISRENHSAINWLLQQPRVEEILILMDLNSQEMSQMKTNVAYDLQNITVKPGKCCVNTSRTCSQNVKQNIERGREEGFYREDFDIDIITNDHIYSTCSIPNYSESPTARVNLFKEYMLHFLHGISIKDLLTSKRN
jgi:hypothetical protein